MRPPWIPDLLPTADSEACEVQVFFKEENRRSMTSVSCFSHRHLAIWRFLGCRRRSPLFFLICRSCLRKETKDQFSGLDRVDQVQLVPLVDTIMTFRRVKGTLEQEWC